MAGRPTSMGNQVEVPRVTPVLSYALLLLQVITFGTYTNIASLQGPEAAEDFINGLSNVHQQVAMGELYRLATSLLVAPSAQGLAVTVFGLATLAPELEAVMGYPIFLSTFVLSGLAGSLAQHMFTGEAATASGISQAASCGAMASVLGVSGALIVHRLRNKGMEDKTGPSDAPNSAVEASSKQKDTRLAVQGGIVLASSALLAFMPLEEGHIGIQLPALLIGVAVGTILGMGQCPVYQVTQQSIIPDGSMIVPEKVQEVVVVVDVRSQFQRRTTAIAVTLGLIAAASTI